jgi:pimeloyl-ACP methyl ester carboxylesterase
MKFTLPILLGLTLAATSCQQYSTVRLKMPAHQSPTPAGERIAHSLKRPSPSPLAHLGGFLDAASLAADVLRKQPNDSQALLDYNFAVARIFGIIHDADLEPWKTPLPCPGASHVWRFSIQQNANPEGDPSDFDIQPADVFKFRGTLVPQRTLRAGLGAPLVVVGKDVKSRGIQPFEARDIFYGMTGVVNFKGSECMGAILDPLAVEKIEFDGRTRPLAADFTAPLALALAHQNHRRKELSGLFRPADIESQVRLERLEPYNPKKIPVLCIHGLGDSQATWAPLIQTLRGQATIRKNYQFWFFSYPTGFPYPFTASVLRRRLDAITAHYPDHKKIVVIGHSMGGMISRTLITDSGMKLWDAFYDQPPAEMPFSAETRQVMTDSLIFKHRTDISRVIFAAASHRGSDVATSFLGRLGARIIGNPGDMVPYEPEVLASVRPNSTGANLKRMPNSIDFLKPDNRFVIALDGLPLARGIPYHSLIGDRGRGGNLSRVAPVSTDGIVPYWSSHIDGAKSETIIPSHHWTNQHPMGIAEIERILREHLVECGDVTSGRWTKPKDDMDLLDLPA